MATGAKRTNFADKRNMPQTRVKDTFFDYLLMRLEEIASRVWRGLAGIFGTTSLVSGGADRFSVSGPYPVYAIDGDGNILKIESVDGDLVYFENANAVVYSIGARHCLIPSGVVRNPRINVINYDTDEDRIGELAEPNSVVEGVGTLTLEVDSVCEVGVSNAGRSVSVWLRRPRTTEEAVAIERNLTVAFVGGKNVVVTSGLLGQGSPASVDVSDYQVALQGLTVRRNLDLSITSPYAFVGTVTGGGAGNPPSAFGVAGQVDVSDGINPDLHTAYLAGRIITPGPAAGGAVKIEASTVGGDLRALLELSRKGAVESSPQAFAMTTKPLDGTAILSLLPLANLPELQEDEAGTLGAIGTVNLTRVGVDAVVGGVKAERDLVRLWDFTPTTGENRFYRINSVAAGVLGVSELDGSPVAGPWGVGDNGNVAVHRVRLSSGEKNAVGLHEACRAPLSLVGQPKINEDETLLRLFPEGATHSAEFLDHAGNKVGRFTRHGVLHLVPNGATTDPMDALLRLRRFDSTSYGHLGIVAEMSRNGRAIPAICIGAVSNGVELQPGEFVDLGVGANVITFTRVGVDLQFEALRIRPDFHLVYVYQTNDPAQEKLYIVASVTGASTLTVKNFDGTTPVFPVGEVGVAARVLLPRFAVADGNTPWGGSVLTGRDSYGNVAPILVYPEGGTLQVFDNGLAGAVNTPRDLIVVDPSRVNSGKLDYPTRVLRSLLVRGGDVSGSPGEESFYSRDGVRIWNAGGLVSDRDPAFPLCVDAGFPEDVPTFHTLPAVAFDEWGAHNRGHHFRDDFIGYDPTAVWTNVYPQPSKYKTFFVGAGTVKPRDLSIHQRYGHGCVELETGGAALDVAELYMPGICCNLDTAKDFRWTFRGVMKIFTTLNTSIVRIGFIRSTANEQYYFSFNPGTLLWEFHYWDGAALQALPLGATAGAVIDEYQWFQIRIVSSTLVAYAIQSKGQVFSGVSGVVSVASLNGNVQGVAPVCRIQTTDANPKATILDYWEVFDREILYARHGSSHNQNHP